MADIVKNNGGSISRDGTNPLGSPAGFNPSIDVTPKQPGAQAKKIAIITSASRS